MEAQVTSFYQKKGGIIQSKPSDFLSGQGSIIQSKLSQGSIPHDVAQSNNFIWTIFTIWFSSFFYLPHIVPAYMQCKLLLVTIPKRHQLSIFATTKQNLKIFRYRIWDHLYKYYEPKLQHLFLHILNDA